MTSRAEVERLRAATSRAVELAKRDLAGFFSTWNLSSPELVRAGLLEIVPVIVREYGDVAATAAAEWYETVRSREVGGLYHARPGRTADPAKVEGSVRWAAGQLFGDDPEHTLALLQGAIQRHIAYAARDTIWQEAARDRARPRIARIPQGEQTCAWCLMLASRGFIYHSKRSAGDTGSGLGDSFHDDCDCALVASFDREAAHIEGYDPDDLYRMYLAARREAGGASPTDRQIARELRRLFPDRVTDRAHPDHH